MQSRSPAGSSTTSSVRHLLTPTTSAQPGMGTEPGLCCGGDQRLAPQNNPTTLSGPVMCSWRGKALNPTPQLGDSAQTPLQQPDRGAQRDGAAQAAPGWAQPPVPAALAGLGMSWPWPLVLLGSIKPFTCLGFQIHRRRQPLRDSWLGTWAVGRGSRHGTGVGAACSRLRSEPDFGSNTSAWAGSQRRGHLRSSAGLGAAGAPGALPARGGRDAGSGAGQEAQPPPEGENGLESG